MLGQLLPVEKRGMGHASTATWYWGESAVDAGCNKFLAKVIEILDASASLDLLYDLKSRNALHGCMHMIVSKMIQLRTKQRRGTSMRLLPLSKSRSLRRVRRAFKMALLALKISSTNATSAVGKYPLICRSYRSFSSPAQAQACQPLAAKVLGKLAMYSPV